MKASLLVAVGALGLVPCGGFGASDRARWEQRVRHVEILRDTWGIAHVFGETDADAVFGFIYAQAEDDFPRIELNYIDALGRRAEIEGESALYRDLRMKLFIDPADLQAKYAESPPWLRTLMDAFADALNYYLHTHPQVRPALITRFEPWMALAFTEGSIGGDIESINLRNLEAFYGNPPTVASPEAPPPSPEAQPRGSNGFAIAPARSESGHALLLINPHTSFYFRPEIHMVSKEGLNAYGAVTWGQFFVYQGFNDRAGWMHTSGGADVIDEYLERVTRAQTGFTYRHGDRQRALVKKEIALRYRRGDGLAEKTVTAYFTHHGPIVRESDGRWVSVCLMQNPIQALTQSYLRTKARSYAEFHRTMELRTNSSNNTVYADADGTIAYFHGNFVPRRNPRFDWNKPVDGSDPDTDWQGLHPVSETITLLNPSNGWIQNTNNWPFSAAGTQSPRRESYPAYMWNRPENPRGINAVRVLAAQSKFSLDGLIAAGYDRRLAAFEQLVPALLASYQAIPQTDPLRAKLAGPIAVLSGWDFRCGVDSIATSVAVFWAQRLLEGTSTEAATKGISIYDYMAQQATHAERLAALAEAVARLERDFGSWRTPWGEINRFQRLSGAITATFNDDRPSWPVGFAPALWGSLAAYSGPAERTTRKIYGTVGNSFVAAVEFGPRIKAKSILAGGVSNDPASPHFDDQAPLYARGEFKDVLFYRDDIERKLERKYRPGQ